VGTKKTYFQLLDEAEKRGKASFLQWEMAKSTGLDIEVVRRESDERQRKHELEMAEYEKYVYDQDSVPPGDK
jgi:hypothetical protein